MLGLALLIAIGIAQEGVGSADVNSIKFGAVFPLWGAWRIWTKKGKYSPFDLTDAFGVDGERVGVAHVVAWIVACVLVGIMLSGALNEALG